MLLPNIRMNLLLWSLLSSIAFCLGIETNISKSTNEEHHENNGPRKSDPNCVCGQTPSESQNKIINGDEVHPPNKYPWMALIKQNQKFNCGGSLINNYFVLTAAHCLLKGGPEIYEVVLGVHNAKKIKYSDPTDIEGETNAIIRKVSKLKIQGSFDTTKPDSPFDIGLIKMSEKVIFNKFISPVCLPSSKNMYTHDGEIAIVTGWGKTETLAPSDVLKEAAVKVLNTFQCQKMSKYGKSITKEMICASSPGKDSCQGDSGGPLVVKRNSSYVQIGIVSWGIGCALDRYPGVYTAVGLFSRFIYAKTRGAKYCSNSEIDG